MTVRGAILQFSIGIMVLVFFLGSAVAYNSGSDREEGAAKQVLGLFEARYRGARTLQATFLERYLENGRPTRTEAGTAYFLRPARMRWEYQSPEKHLFLVDGKTAWFYVPEDHTVTRVPARQSTDLRTPLALLAGEMKVSRVCARVELATSEKAETEQNVMLHCTLRAANNSLSEKDDAVFFEIVRATGELSRLLTQEPGGIRIELRFENWRINPPLSAAMFQFDLPPGVAIVNGELPASDTAVK